MTLAILAEISPRALGPSRALILQLNDQFCVSMFYFASGEVQGS